MVWTAAAVSVSDASLGLLLDFFFFFGGEGAGSGRETSGATPFSAGGAVLYSGGETCWAAGVTSATAAAGVFFAFGLEGLGRGGGAIGWEGKVTGSTMCKLNLLQLLGWVSCCV